MLALHASSASLDGCRSYQRPAMQARRSLRLCHVPTACLSAATAPVYSDTAHTALASSDLPYGIALEQALKVPSPLKLTHLLRRRPAQAEVPPLLAPCHTHSLRRVVQEVPLRNMLPPRQARPCSTSRSPPCPFSCCGFPRREALPGLTSVSEPIVARPPLAYTNPASPTHLLRSATAIHPLAMLTAEHTRTPRLT